MPISPDLKASWIEALRRGEYTQCHGEYHRPDGSYCALGVLLHLENVPDEMLDDGAFIYTDERTGEPAYRVDLTNWMETTLCLEQNVQATIIHLNDNNYATFKEIAEYLERRKDI